MVELSGTAPESKQNYASCIIESSIYNNIKSVCCQVVNRFRHYQTCALFLGDAGHSCRAFQ